MIDTRDNGWIIRLTPDGEGGYGVSVLDPDGLPAEGFEPQDFDGQLSLSKAEDVGLGWAEANPRYTHASEINMLGNGHFAVVKRHDGKTTRLGPYPTLEDVDRNALGWIDARIAQEFRIAELRRERGLELAGEVAKLMDEIDTIDSQRKYLGDEKKGRERTIRRLVFEARNPQVPLDLNPTVTESMECLGFETFPGPEDDGIEDNGPVADANGRHHDGPRAAKRGAKKAGKKAGKTGKKPTRSGGLDPSKIVWPEDRPDA